MINELQTGAPTFSANKIYNPATITDTNNAINLTVDAPYSTNGVFFLVALSPDKSL